MQDTYLSISQDKKKLLLSVRSILYVIMNGKTVEIHALGGVIYRTRMKFADIEATLGDNFLHLHRGCTVSALAIHEVGDKIRLNNGETLDYTRRKKKEIIGRLGEIQKHVIAGFDHDGTPLSAEEYRAYYRAFEKLPFAFTDIELIFNDSANAVDWIFRYGNEALAKLEKVSLDRLIDHSFGSVFPNMDSKWLNAYERATLYGETLEIIDYSPEIDTNLKVICFPTFKGHCGCILFDIRDIRFIKNSDDAEKAMLLSFGQMIHNNN